MKFREEGHDLPRHHDHDSELVPLPAADVDPSRTFYTDILGFNLDNDVQPGNGMRIVQLTPPGSACSIVIGASSGYRSSVAGTVKDLHLVVENSAEARDQPISHGAPVSDSEVGRGVKFEYFSDPDGNSWTLQETGNM